MSKLNFIGFVQCGMGCGRLLIFEEGGYDDMLVTPLYCPDCMPGVWVETMPGAKRYSFVHKRFSVCLLKKPVTHHKLSK